MRMERLRLAAVLVLFATGGCACQRRAAAPAGVPTVVVAVTVVDGPAIEVLGAAAAAHPAGASDGHASGDRVEIEWLGSWLPATLVERRGDRWLVRYEAGDNGDYAEETVERERIRLPVAAPDDEVGEVDVDP